MAELYSLARHFGVRARVGLRKAELCALLAGASPRAARAARAPCERDDWRLAPRTPYIEFFGERGAGSDWAIGDLVRVDTNEASVGRPLGGITRRANDVVTRDLGVAGYLRDPPHVVASEPALRRLEERLGVPREVAADEAEKRLAQLRALLHEGSDLPRGLPIVDLTTYLGAHPVPFID